MGTLGIFRKKDREATLEGGAFGTEIKVSEAPEFRIRTRFTRRRVAVGLFVFYLIAIPVYLYIGMQPTGSATAYAEEAKSATGSLEIPSISLSAPMADVELDGRILTAPEYIVGRYTAHKNKVLVMGHSSTIFQRLKEVEVSDELWYDDERFVVVSKEVRAKAEISMREILRDEDEPTLVLMTCSGEHITGQDYSHRLIMYAKRA
ncbi:class F sortase [Candidatus Saccharibacteria bacterium]|nr:class F sortase [Candidatus Saccharibacteria bacterium]